MSVFIGGLLPMQYMLSDVFFALVRYVNSNAEASVNTPVFRLPGHINTDACMRLPQHS
jgi:hypothetical protein